MHIFLCCLHFALKILARYVQKAGRRTKPKKKKMASGEKKTILYGEARSGIRDDKGRRRYNEKMLGRSKMTAENILAELRRATTTSDEPKKIIEMHQRRLDIFQRRFVPFITSLVSSSDTTLRKVSDFNHREWGLRPGTQIFYKGAFGLDAAQHHGIYLGYGLICEVGGKWCKSSRTGFLEQCLSINTLNDFVIRGKGSIFKVVYDHIDLGNMETLREQLRRALEMVSKRDWDYSVFTNNCQHWSSYVAKGEREVTQLCDLRARKKRVEKVNLVHAEECKGKPCRVMATTINGEGCKSPVAQGLRGRYCYTDDENRGNWDWVGSIPTKYVCEGTRRKSGRKKYNRCLKN